MVDRESDAPEPPDPSDAPDPSDVAEEATRWWVRPVLVLLGSLVVGWLIVKLVGAIDWAAVGSAIGRLEPWQVLPLTALLLVRQGLNAVPLARFVPGLPWRRSLQSDLSANLLATVAPPPSDIVLRVGMFRSWGVDPVDGMAGVTLNMIAFYSVRFLAPVLALLLLVVQGAEDAQWVLAIGSGVLAMVILVALALMMRSDALAAVLGSSAARAVKRFRAGADPAQWAQATVDFRARMAQRLRGGLPVALAAMIAMVFADGLIVLCALRFVGVPAHALSALDVLAAFLFAYPMTILPLFGFGALDASLIAAWTVIAGLAFEPTIVAGLVVWRVFTLLGPLLLGAGTVWLWRRDAAALARSDAERVP